MTIFEFSLQSTQWRIIYIADCTHFWTRAYGKRIIYIKEKL